MILSEAIGWLTKEVLESGRARYLWYVLAVVGIIAVGAILIAVVSRWRKRGGGSSSKSANDQLSEFRSLYEQGVISKEEFDQLRSFLAGKIHEEMHVQPAAKVAPVKRTENANPSIQKEPDKPAPRASADGIHPDEPPGL